MSGWKIQKFFGDLLYDLRSRNLLPVVVMLAVGVVAVPFLISRGSSGNGAVSVGPSASAVSSPEAENAVVAYHPPGIRNLKTRLNDLGPKNPFVQQFTGGGSQADGSSSTTLDGVVPNSGSIPGLNGVGTGGGGSGGSGSNGNSGGNGSSGGGGGGKTQTVYSYYQTDITIGEAGGTAVPAHNLRQFQFLPSPDKPALVYLGTASSGRQALFLVSKDVTSVGGNGVCFPSADECQLLGLNAGTGADFYYAPDGKTYHVQVTRIRRVTSSKPPG
jgi:hypothetical protein